MRNESTAKQGKIDPNSLQGECFRRRENGETFYRIGRDLGIADGHVKRLWLATKAGTVVNSRKRPPMPAFANEKIARFADGLSRGLTAKDAAIQAGVSEASASQWASTTRSSPSFKSEFHSMLERLGFTQERLVRRHISLIDAEKTQFFQKDGKVVEQRTVEDNQTRVKALELGWELFGRRQVSAPTAANTELTLLVGLPRFGGAAQDGAAVAVRVSAGPSQVIEAESSPAQPSDPDFDPLG